MVDIVLKLQYANANPLIYQRSCKQDVPSVRERLKSTPVRKSEAFEDSDAKLGITDIVAENDAVQKLVVINLVASAQRVGEICMQFFSIVCFSA